MRKSAVVCLLLISLVAHAREAKTFTVVPSGAQSIDPKTDHFSIVFEAGWISKKDNLFRTLFQSATKLTAEADAQSTFFGVPTPLKTARIFNNNDIGNQLDRPWGGSSLVVVSDYPADTNVTLDAKATVYNDDRFNDLLQTFQQNEPTSGIDVTAELGYAKLADGLFIDLFKTNQASIPFTMEVDVIPLVGSFKEYYVIGIAPNFDKSDSLLKNIEVDSSKLAYNESDSTLSYNNQSIDDHSWAVFKVQKAAVPNIVQLGMSASTAPWAVLANNDFYLAQLPQIKSADDAHKQDNLANSQLNSELTLLKNELSFSAYDRAVALKSFAQQAKATILASCVEGNVTTAECTTPSIDTFTTRISADFGLNPSNADSVDATAKKVAGVLRQQLTLNPK